MRIAIVEDIDAEAEILSDCLKKFEKENNIEITITAFKKATDFLGAYNNDYDIVFFDIEMPDLDGMQAAKKLRKIDKFVTIIFVTKMAQAAIEGYEVGAIDFVVKPVNYNSFALKFKRAMSRLSVGIENDVLIKTETGFVRVSSARIIFLDVLGHYVTFHTTEGDFTEQNTLKNIENRLAEYQKNFAKCNRCYLVNLKFVRSIENNEVIVGDHKLPVSRSYKKSFLTRLSKYISGSAKGE